MILIPAQFAPTTQTAYPNYTGSEFIVDYCVARNSDTIPQTLMIWVGASDASGLRLAVTINPGQTYICSEIVGDTLAATEAMWVSATAATIAIKVSGRSR